MAFRARGFVLMDFKRQGCSRSRLNNTAFGCRLKNCCRTEKQSRRTFIVLTGRRVSRKHGDFKVKTDEVPTSQRTQPFSIT